MPISTPTIPDRAIRVPRGLAGRLRVPRRPSGFTLIEMMVVIFIVGLAATVVVVSMPGGSDEVRSDAERFAQRVAAARDEGHDVARGLGRLVSQEHGDDAARRHVLAAPPRVEPEHRPRL